jgi:TonB family protein
MLPVPIALIRWSLVLIVGTALTGCTNSEFVTEHPVANAVPSPKPGVYPVQTVDVRPVSTHEVEPDDPPELGSILSGKAVVVFTVRADGKVADASVLQADDVLFGEAAVAAISQWRFHPAELKGAPVDCQMTLPFVFTSPYGYGAGGDLRPDPTSGTPPAGSGNMSITPR